MKRKFLKLLSIILLFAVVIAGCLFYAIYISPAKLDVSYHTISSKKIPQSIEDITIGYFSDLYYLEFMDDKRLNDMMEIMKNRDVDVLLFGGDLFSDPSSAKIDAKVITKMTQVLSQLEAPLGKFYVLGDRDKMSSTTETLVSTILYNSGFENLTNKNTKIHNGNKEDITLIGLDTIVRGKVDAQAAFANTSNDAFNIVFTHTPDSVSLISSIDVDLAFAGHSLGGQIFLPVIGPMAKVEGANKYMHGIYNINKMELNVSNGLGTTGFDMRLFCPPQFTIYRLTK